MVIMLGSIREKKVVNVECHRCGTIFPRDYSRVLRNLKKGCKNYCSRKCAAIALGERRRGKKASKETRQNLSKVHKGKSFTREHRRKISEAIKGNTGYWKGKHLPEETKAKIRKSHKGLLTGEKHPMFGKKGEETPFFGRHHTKETKKRMSEKRKHRIFPTIDTKPELIFIDIYKKFGIADRVKDTRDNSFHIGRLNPDFIIPDMKIAIFVNGDYWHSPLLNHKIKPNRTANHQVKTCKKYKWKAVILWGTDLLREDAEAFVLSMFKKEGII